MPLIRFPTVKGLVYTIDLTKIADRENPRTVEAAVFSTTYFTGGYTVDWGDGSSDTYTTEAYPEHTYAEGAGDIFTVVIRSATGKLPFCKWLKANSAAEESNPSTAVTRAIVSFDHFAGSLPGTTVSLGAVFRGCRNLEYMDTRYVGYYAASTLVNACDNCNSLEQSAESFCFSFSSSVTGAGALFNNCRKLQGELPADFLDGLTACAQFNNTFYYCQSLDGAPYVFWKADGSLDTDKFPSLTSAANCYSNCKNTLRAQVPTDYGGTMTVS